MADPFADLDAATAAQGGQDLFSDLDAAAPADPFADLDEPAPADPRQSVYGGTVVGALERGIQGGLQSLNTDVAQVLGKIPLVGGAIRRGLLSDAAANERRMQVIPRPQEEGIIRQTVTDVVESLPRAAGAIGAAIATRGASLLPQALAVGAASGLTERSAEVDNFLKERGVDYTDPAAIEAAYNNPELMAQARGRANVRGAVVGAADAATLGVSGKLAGGLLRAGRPVAAAAAGLGVEATGGGAGEALAQVATDGSVTNWDSVRREALGEILPGAVEVGAAVLNRPARPGTGARIVNMPAMTPEYLAQQQRFSNAGAAPGSVSPAAGQATTGSPAGAAPAPFDMFSDLDGLDRVDRTDVSGAAAGGMGGPVAQGAPAAGGQAPQGRTAGAADTGLTPMSRPAGASVPVSPDAEKQISAAISTRKGFPVRKGSAVDVLRQNRSGAAETLKAKIIGIVDENTVRVEYTGLTYAQKKLKLPTEVDVGVISEPANVAGMRRRARILGELPQEERRQVVADSRAFNDLLEQSPGLYDVQTAMRLGDLPNPREAAMKRSQLRRDALAVAKRELGLPEDADMSSPVVQARALPMLREYTGQAAAAEVRAAPEVNEIGFQDIGHNDLVFAKGSWFRVELDGDGAIKSLKDGETIQLADVPWDTLNVSGRLSPGDTGYDQALAQYAQQTRPDAARAAEVVAEEGIGNAEPSFKVSGKDILPTMDWMRARLDKAGIFEPLNRYGHVGEDGADEALWVADRARKGLEIPSDLAAKYPEFVDRRPEDRAPVSAGVSPSGQVQLLGQEEGGFALTGGQVAPQGPSLDEQAAARKAQADHLARMGDLFAGPPSTETPGTSASRGPTKGNVKGSGWGSSIAGQAVEDVAAARAAAGAGPVAPRQQYARMPFAMPEMLEFIRRTMGRAPMVMKNPGGKRLGFFRPNPLNPEGGDIGMRASVYQVIDERERAAIAQEAKAVVRADIEAQVAQSGNPPMDPGLLDAKVNAEYLPVYQALFKEREAKAKREKGSAAALQVLAHEGPGHWGDYYPGDVGWARGNFFGRVAKLSNYLMTTMAEHPAGLGDFISKQDRRRLRAAAERAEGPKPPVGDREEWLARVRDTYRELLDQEARNRGLVQLKDVKAELEPLVAWWNGTDTIPDYFKSSEELYAETLSVFMLAPQQMLHRAPITYALLNNWMGRNPKFKETFDEFQGRMISGDYKGDRVARWREMFRRADADAAMMEENTSSTSAREIWDSMLVYFDRNLGPVYARIRDLRREDMPTWLRKRDAIKRAQYVGGEQKAMAAVFNKWVADELAPSGWTYEDFNEYRFHQRVVEERFNLANPGTDAKASFERLRDWQAEVGPERWAALEKANAGFTRQIMDALADPEWVQAVGPELAAKLQANPWYATFAVTPEGRVPAKDSLQAMMGSTFGNSVGGGIYRQFGTHQNIRSPVTATIQKMMAMRSWARRNTAKKELGEFFLQTGEALPAEFRWDGKARVPIIKDGPRIATITWMDGGQQQAAYVPRALASGFDTSGTVEFRRAMRILSMFNAVPKALATRYNPLFWSYQLVRDLMDAPRKTPGITLAGMLREFPDAVRSAYSIIHGVPDDVAMQAMRRNVGIHSHDRVELTENDIDFERLMKGWHLRPADGLRGITAAEPKLLGGMKRFWHTFANASEVLEHSVKIAAMKQLDARMPDMPEAQKKYWLQTLAGSPDFMDKGLANPALDLFAMFYNAAKQGWRSEVEAYQAHRDVGQRAAYAQKLVIYGILPKLAMYALAQGLVAGLLPGEDKDWREWYASIPDYDKVNYFVLPLGWANKDKKEVAYVRVPLSETQRVVGGMFWKMLASPDRPGPDVISYGADTLPGANPLLKAARAGLEYFLLGRNPPNDRGGNVVRQSDFQERGAEASRQVVDFMLQNSLGVHPVGRVVAEAVAAPPRGDTGRTDPGFWSALGSLASGGLWGRWVKVSNGGVFDTVYAAAERIQQQQSREHRILREAAEAGELTGEARRLVEGSKLLADYYRNTRKEITQRANNGGILDKAILRANTKREREAMRDALREAGFTP